MLIYKTVLFLLLVATKLQFMVFEKFEVTFLFFIMFTVFFALCSNASTSFLFKAWQGHHYI